MQQKILDKVRKTGTILTDRYDNALSLIKTLAALQVMFGHVSQHLELPVSFFVKKASGYFSGVPVFLF